MRNLLFSLCLVVCPWGFARAADAPTVDSALDKSVDRALVFLQSTQLADGGWAIYPGGPAEISASVKAYFALKIVGMKAEEPVLERARAAILAMGGAQACNSFTRFYLALLGQISYDDCPCVPPELVLTSSS